LYYFHGSSIKKPNKKNLVKKTNQKDPNKMVGSKLTLLKWHFGQVGHGGKKTEFFCSEAKCSKNVEHEN
jgi:hypothetical protein